jgi:hypothetical protein
MFFLGHCTGLILYLYSDILNPTDGPGLTSKTKPVATFEGMTSKKQPRRSIQRKVAPLKYSSGCHPFFQIAAEVAEIRSTFDRRRSLRRGKTRRHHPCGGSFPKKFVARRS